MNGDAVRHEEPAWTADLAKVWDAVSKIEQRVTSLELGTMTDARWPTVEEQTAFYERLRVENAAKWEAYVDLHSSALPDAQRPPLDLEGATVEEWEKHGGAYSAWRPWGDSGLSGQWEVYCVCGVFHMQSVTDPSFACRCGRQYRLVERVEVWEP